MAHSPRNGSARPQSTIVQSFAADLDGMFGLDAVGDLAQTVNEKRQMLSTKDRELQELEARIRETEERLARVSRNASPARGAEPSSGTTAPTTTTSQAAATHLAPPQASSGSAPTRQAPLPPRESSLPGQQSHATERPRPDRVDTKKLMQGMPGALPETPRQELGGGGDYVMVEGASEGGLGTGQAER